MEARLDGGAESFKTAVAAGKPAEIAFKPAEIAIKPAVVSGKQAAAAPGRAALQSNPREAEQSNEATPQAKPIEASGPAESAPPSWPDEAAESAMVSELRARGEVVVPSASTNGVEETDSGALPPLDELVQKIPAEVRDVLDELFRARFVTVKRVPKKALK